MKIFLEGKNKVDLRQEDNLEDTFSDSGIRCRSLKLLGYLQNDHYPPNLSHKTNCFSRRIFEKNKNKLPVITFYVFIITENSVFAYQVSNNWPLTKVF